MQLVLSSVHYREIGAFSSCVERIELLAIINKLGRKITTDPIVARKRAEELINRGVGVADAAHVAFAESAGAHFITCDDKLLKKCKK